MRARHISALAILAIGGSVLAALGAVAWWMLHREPEGSAALAAPVAEALTPDPEVDARARAAEAEAERAVELAHVEPLASASPRSLGVVPPPPDTLVALRGRVVDAESDEPLSGMTLSLLSRRPKTVAIRTDEEGRFATGYELASGVVSALHVADVSQPRFAARWDLEPAQFVVPPNVEGVPTREITLRAKSPRQVLEVEVLTPEGLPASGATVSMSAGERDASGAFVADDRDFEVADARGRVRFALLSERVFDRSYRVEAEHRGTLASDVLVLDPPFSMRVRTLELVPGGVVRVALKNDEGRPIPGVSVRASTFEGGRFTSAHTETSDARGECVFAPLRAACWTIDVVHPLTGRSTQREVDLPRAGHAQLEVPLTLSGLRLGLSGSVVDEHGYPLAGVQVAVQASGEEPVTLESGEAGRFEYWGRAEGPLSFGVGGGFLDDAFEPAFATVPFGSQNLVVRRVEAREASTAALVIVDEATHEPVRRASVVLYHAHAPAHALSPGVSRANAESGVAQIVYKPSEGASYCIDAPGYLRAQGRIADLVETAGPRMPLCVELERGFERRVEVRDRVTRRIVANATFSTGAGPLAKSGPDGSALLRASDWPPPLRVEASGYEPLLWDPAQAPYPGTVVWLEPVRGERR